MSKKVYAVVDGRVVEVSKGASLPKDALLFSTSGKSLRQINEEKRARSKRDNEFLSKRLGFTIERPVR